MPSRVRDIAKFVGQTENSNRGDFRLNLASEVGGGLQVYDSIGLLPVVGLTSGDQALVTSTNRLYVSNGSGWYNIALVNATPVLSVSQTGTIDLSSAVNITVTATDSDNSNATLSLSVESGGDFFKLATLALDSSVYTITPRSEDSAVSLGYDGSATLTFKATDGISIASVQNTFTLSFGPDWTQTPAQHRIPNGDGTAYDYFGIRNDLSSSGDRFAVISSTGGEVEIWAGSGSSWTREYKVTSGMLGASAFHLTGDIAMSHDGSIVAYGRPDHPHAGTAEGNINVRTRSGSTWSAASGGLALAASDKANSDLLGCSIDISGDGNYIVAGARGDGSGTGSAYIFFQGSTHTWAQQAKIVASGGAASEEFGNAIDIDTDGTRLIVGAWKEDNSGNTEDFGAAYIFKRSGTSWAQEARIVSSDLQQDDEFGVDVAISGDGTLAIVGAAFEDTGGSNSGAAYIFKRSGTSWSQEAKLVASDATFNDNFGFRVALTIDGKHALVSAPNETATGPYGAAYIFKNTTGSTWVQQRILHQASRQVGRFGDGISVNTDGSIMLCGAFQETAGSSNAGALYVNYFS